MQSILKTALIICAALLGPAARSQCSLTVVPTASGVCAGFQSTLTAFGATTYTWSGGSLSNPVYNQSVAVFAGTYKVKGSSTNCVDSLTITIGTAPPLNISASASSPTTCISSNLPLYSKTVALTATGASTYAWSSNVQQPGLPGIGPQLIVIPPASACYTVQGSTSACSGSAALCLTVTPQFTLITSPLQGSTCIGFSTTMAVTNVGVPAVGPPSAFSYNWTEPPGTTLASFNTPTVIATPYANTVYSVEVTDALGCVSAISTVTITTNPCPQGIQQINQQAAQVYFAGSQLCVQAPAPIQLQLFNLTGNSVNNKTSLEAGRHELSLATLPPGIYFVKISEGERERCLKVVRGGIGF